MPVSAPITCRLVVLAVLAALAALGCDETVDEPDDPAGEVFLPAFEALEPGWNTLLPGGETTCARGGEYAFFVRPGDRQRVHVNFAGGASCWKTSNCSPQLAIFPDDVDGNRAAVAAGAVFPGIFDTTAPDNPFADWTHVVVSYCTGDNHLGDATGSYDGFSVEHRGAVNARAVLDWVERELAPAEQLLVSGCGAGGYGAPLWLADLRARFAQAATTLYVDSAAGLLPPEVIEAQGDAWQAWARYPAQIPGLDPDMVARGSLDQEVVLTALADHFDDVTFAVVNSAEDQVQRALHEQAGGSGDWSARMAESVERLRQSAPDLRALIVPGAVHCLLFDAAFFSADADGTPLVDWLAGVVGP